MKKIKAIFPIVTEVLCFVFIGIICNKIPFEHFFSEISFLNFSVNLEDITEYIDYIKVFVFIVLESSYWKCITSFNSEKLLFNGGDFYKNYPYWLYFVSSKLLGFKYCTLKNVPIWLQFKLLLNNLFVNFLTGDNLDEDSNQFEEDLNEPVVDVINSTIKTNSIDLILSDTYPITQDQLPKFSKGHYSIEIARTNQPNGNRMVNYKFVNKIQEMIYKLPKEIDTLNIYATTNPMHNKLIVQKILSLGNRTQIKHINVAQQNSRSWKFDKLMKIK